METLTHDLSELTTIPKVTLETLIDKSVLCIAHNVFETLKQQEIITQINIGLGTLYISVVDNEIKYKFIPSNKLVNCVTDTVLNNRSPLITKVEQTLVDKITNTYKTYF